VSELLNQVENIEADTIEDMSELLHRDINRIDNDRYENGALYITPGAISPTTASRSGVATHINDIIAGGHPLTLSLNSLATKILFDTRGNATKPKAVGVQYLVGEALYSADARYDGSQTGETKTVRAKKEVIVSGGAFNTPQILKLSGVGPREELEELGIPVVVDNPAVGKYLHDNYEFPVHVRGQQAWINGGATDCTLTYDEQDPCFVEWENNQSGPYASRGGTFGMIWRSNQSWDNDSDIMLLNGIDIGGQSGFYPGYSRARVPLAGNWVLIVVKMQTANAAGSVTLRSKDPREAPQINFNYYAEDGDKDLQAITESVDLLLGAFNATGIPYEVVTPGIYTDIKQAIKDLSYSHHASSTCRVGPAGSKEHCVDSKFRVNGVDNLRVVDASVLPRSPGGMINGPTFTISQKAFDVIMEENSGNGGCVATPY
jgi:choline dehydrogenase